MVEDPTGWHLALQNLGDVAGYISVGLTAMLATKAQVWLESRKARRQCRLSVDQSMVTNRFLTETRVKVDCDRVTITQFHNGDHFASGASVQRLTLSHFAIRTGISVPNTLGGNASLIGTPASYMACMLDAIFKNGMVVISDFKVDDEWLERYLAINGLTTTVICLIRGSHPMEGYGFIAFSWLDHKDVTPAIVEECMDYAKKAAAYL